MSDEFAIRALSPETWDAFDALVERRASFLYNGTRALYESAGFTYERSKGLNHTVMRRTLAPA